MKYSFCLLSVCVLLSYFSSKVSATVVVQSIDALGFDTLQNYIKESDTDHGLFSDNTYAIHKLEVSGTGNTGPSHASALRGIPASEGGWIGNNFLLKTDNSFVRDNAFSLANNSFSPNIARIAKGQRLTVACLNMPTITSSEDCSLFLGYAPQIVDSCLWSPLSKLEESSCYMDHFIENVTLNDSANSITIKTGGIVHRFSLGEIGTMCWISNEEHFSRIVYFHETDDQSENIYFGPVFKLNADEAFRALPAPLSCWPGGLDARAVRQGKLTLDAFNDILRHKNDYGFSLLQHVLASRQYDLILSYTSYLDSLQHEFKDSSDISPHIIDAISIVDSNLNDIGNMLKASDSLIVFSDHGMRYAHSFVTIETLLETVATKIKAIELKFLIATSGSLAHVYFTKAGSEDDKNRFIAYLRQMKHDDTFIFKKVLTKDMLKNAGLSNARSGDIVLFANDGYSFSPRASVNERFIFPTVATPKDPQLKRLSKKEKQFVLNGTPNRVSPGVHGDGPERSEINGFFMTKKDKNSNPKQIHNVFFSIVNELGLSGETEKE